MKIVVLLMCVLMALAACSKKGDGANGDQDNDALKAKTAEAIDSLDKLTKGAQMYFGTAHVTQTGNLIACQFPASTGWAPAGDPCKNKSKRFEADPEAWAGATWTAMLFQMTDAHYFKYKIDSSGTVDKATITITASADLDCDGKWSTYKRVIKADPQTTSPDCVTLGPGAMETKDELE